MSALSVWPRNDRAQTANHQSDRRLFGFIAGKRSIKFRILEAACRHRQWTTQTSLWKSQAHFMLAAIPAWAVCRIRSAAEMQQLRSVAYMQMRQTHHLFSHASLLAHLLGTFAMVLNGGSSRLKGGLANFPLCYLFKNTIASKRSSLKPLLLDRSSID